MLKLPYLQIRSNLIISYNLPVEKYIRSTALNDRLTQILRETPTYSGLLCPGAKKRLTRSIELFSMAVNSEPEQRIINPSTGKAMSFKFNFITLTIYSTDRNITGKEAHKQCLEPFLQWMRRVQKVKLYIWKAELQKRGQIHYHITTNKYIDKDDIRNKWNQLQRDAGYLDTFYKKYGRWNAPSTHVKKVRHVRDMASYLTKEIAKTMQNGTSIGGKVWDCSMNLKTSQYYTTDDCTGEYAGRINQMVRDKQLKVVYTDNCCIFKTIQEPAFKILNNRDLLEYQQHLSNVVVKEQELIRKRAKKHEIIEHFASNIALQRFKIVPVPDLFSSS